MDDKLRRTLPVALLALLIAACASLLLIAGACMMSVEAATATPPPTATFVPQVIVTPTPASATLAPATLTPVALPPTLAPTADANAAAAVDPPAFVTVTGCTARTDWQPYTVQVGDTVGGLAIATNTPLQDIINGNCLADPDLIAAGQTLYLPRPPAAGIVPVAVTAAPGEDAPAIGYVLVEPALVESGQYLIAPGQITVRAQGVSGATSVSFYFAPTGTEGGPVLLGTDDNMNDGAVILWTVDRMPFVANVWAIASSGNLQVATDPILVANNG